MRGLISLVLPIVISCTFSAIAQENDTVLGLKAVLSDPELSKYYHLDDGIDSTLRVLQNNVIGSDLVFSLKDKHILFSNAFQNEVRFIEFTYLEFTYDKIKLNLKIDYEGIEMNAILEKHEELWIVKKKLLIEH